MRRACLLLTHRDAGAKRSAISSVYNDFVDALLINIDGDAARFPWGERRLTELQRAVSTDGFLRLRMHKVNLGDPLWSVSAIDEFDGKFTGASSVGAFPYDPRWDIDLKLLVTQW